MNAVPIQVTEEGVLIPKVYLNNADAVEVVWASDYVLIKPQVKVPDDDPANAVDECMSTQRQRRFSFIGSGRTQNPRASVEAEEILEREVKRTSGWKLNQ